MQYEKLGKSPATYRQRLDKALTTLAGIVEGIDADRHILTLERQYLDNWLIVNESLAPEPPLKEFFMLVQDALLDNVLSAGEREDILEGTRSLSSGYYDAISSGLQELMGIAAGIASDGSVAAEELKPLRDWLEDHDHLRRHFPFDEIDSLVLDAMKDGVVDAEEGERLTRIFAGFVSVGQNRTLHPGMLSAEDAGIAAACQQVEFNGKVFCVTGASPWATRNQIFGSIESAGGFPADNVTAEIDYLVYCDGGSKCWAYSCYGRKIEKAVSLRQRGSSLLIIRECDLWDSLADLGIAKPATRQAARRAKPAAGGE